MTSFLAAFAITFSSQEAFDLEFPPADVARIVPMKLDRDDLPIPKPDFGNSLPLPPTAAAIKLTQSRYLPDAGSGGNRLDTSDLA
jgi:hypothetical protein